jgi:hypothetical protein
MGITSEPEAEAVAAPKRKGTRYPWLRTPVAAWAAVGVFFAVFQASVYGRWIAAGGFDLRVRGLHSLSTSRQATLLAAQGVVVLIVVATVVWLVRRCSKERRLTFDALLFVGFASEIWLNSLISGAVLWDTAAVHVPAWGPYIPGGSIFGLRAHSIEPVMDAGLGYMTALAFVLVSTGAVRLLVLRRRPELSGVPLTLLLLGSCIFFTFLMEIIWVGSGAYAYRHGVPGLSLFLGSWNQVPIPDSVFNGIFWFGIPCVVRYHLIRNGPESGLLRGTRHLPVHVRTLAQGLAVIGLLNLGLLSDMVVIRLISLIPGPAAANLPYPFV